MKNSWSTKFCVLVIGVGAGTCGPESGESTGEMRCRDSAKLAAENADALCGCWVADGTYPDQQSCVAAFTVEDSYYDCVCPIYAKYPEVNAYLDCAEPAQDALIACIEASGCDEEKQAACTDKFITDIMACEPPPEALFDEATAKCDEPMP